MTVPSVTDWAWLGQQSREHIARCGTQESEPATWLKQAYAWLYARLEPEQRSTLPLPIADPGGPSRGMIPILGATGAGDGHLGFVSVRCEPTAHRADVEDARQAASNAAGAVADVFRRLDADLGQPHVELLVSDGGGTSVGLSTVIATLATVLSLTPREDFAATGCWDESGKLTPVDAATLKNKIKVAKRWGYRRLLVVEGQQGIPSDCSLECVEVPCSLPYALFAILRNAFDSPTAQAIARILAVFDQKVVRGDQDLTRTLEVTQDFTAPAAPELARHVAHDIRGRALLHAGRTEEAACEKAQADALRPGPMDFPSGWLGNYLRWQQAAHHAVMALDQGRWEDTEPEHELLDRTLDRLVGAIADRQAGREELLAAMFLSNTRGRRLDFLGRWHRDGDLLCRAWEDLVRFHPHWPALFKYCEEAQRRDTTLKRQQNYCLDVVASYWHLKGHVPQAWLEIVSTFWPEAQNVELEDLDPFDLANLLRWKAISGQDVDADLVRQGLQLGGITFDAYQGAYPSFLVFETILRYQLGTEEQRRQAADHLARSELFRPDLPPTSILTLLALRAEKLLVIAEVCHRGAIRPAPGTTLDRRADDMLSTPNKLLDRCPY